MCSKAIQIVATVKSKTEAHERLQRHSFNAVLPVSVPQGGAGHLTTTVRQLTQLCPGVQDVQYAGMQSSAATLVELSLLLPQDCRTVKIASHIPQ